MTFDVLIHPEIIRGTNPIPQHTRFANDPTIRTQGQVWRGQISTQNGTLPLLSLTERDSWLEIDIPGPTTAVGVQFWGDRNDGWATIFVDGEEAWSDNTVGRNITYERYIEIRNLPRDRHTLRVEVTGVIGRPNGDVDVTVVAFGWEPLPADGAISVFSRGLPDTDDVGIMFNEPSTAPEPSSRSLPEILRGKNPTPANIFKIPEQLFQISPQELNTPGKKFEIAPPKMRLNGPIWRGTVDVIDMESDPQVKLLALTQKGSWVEVSFTEPATAIGVQFWGDENDGFARILIEGDNAAWNPVWEGNTVGSPNTYEGYIEITGLENKSHKLRIEAIGKIGQPNGDVHVTIAAFGLGEVPQGRGGTTQNVQIFVPIIRNGAQ